MSFELIEQLESSAAKYDDFISVARNGVYLYGAGFVGRWSVYYLEGIGIPVLGFIDSDENKWGNILNGKKIVSLSDACATGVKAIVITSRHAVKPIDKILTPLPAITMSIDAIVVHQAQRDGRLEKVQAFFLHDKKSLHIFNAVLCSMLSGTSLPLFSLADSKPFFDRFGFFNRDQEIFVDAGAYVGDSLERFIWSVNGVFHQVHAFEPGAAQFSALKKRVARLSEEWALRPSSIFLVNKGLCSKDRVVLAGSSKNLIQMTVNNVGQSCVDAEHVELTSLDSYFGENKYTLLKVDVEGSEAELLRGARLSISLHKPRIALSVYHYPTDIFELPLQLKEIYGGYSFFLGHHSSQLMDTVLYASDNNG